MCANLELYNKVREVPKEALKEIKAGRLKGMSDINPMWRIKMLTEQFGVCGFGWYVEEVEKWNEQGKPVYNGELQLLGHEIATFVKINLYVKMGDEWSKPIVGIGGSSFLPFENNGFYTDNECYKKAYTDAISVACKALGIGANVYFEKDPSKYDSAMPDANVPFPEAVINPATLKKPEQKPPSPPKTFEEAERDVSREWAKKYALPANTEYPGIKLGDLFKMNNEYFRKILVNPPDVETGKAARILDDWVKESKMKGATA